MKSLPEVRKADESASHDGISTPDYKKSISGAIKRRRLASLILLLVLTLASLLYYAVINPQTFGAYHDDGIYVVTAKAMAEGEGYRILSLPYEPAQTKYPPLYPALLSLIWRAMPEFPSNILPMMMLSVMATVVFLALSYRYLVREGYAGEWQAVVIVGLVAFNWRTIILGTSIYTEMLYAMLSVISLMLAEKYEKEPEGRSYGLLLGVSLGLCFLTRSAGVSLIGAVGVYYALRGKWKKAILPVVVGGAFIIGWLAWSRANRTSFEGVNTAFYTNYFGFARETIIGMQAANNSSLIATILNMIGTNIIGVIILSVPVVCLGLSYQSVVYLGFAFLFIAAGFIRHMKRGMRLLHIYIISYLALLLPLWPYMSYDRYLVPLLPFLMMYLITEIEALFSLVRKNISKSSPVISKISAGLVGLAILLAIGSAFYYYGLGLKWLMSSASFTKAPLPSKEDAQAIEWIRANTSPQDVVVCYRDPVYYLYTGRKATRSMPMKLALTWRDDQKLLFDIIRESDAGYVVYTSSDFDIENQPADRRESLRELLESAPDVFIPVYESSDGQSKIHRTGKKAE